MWNFFRAAAGTTPPTLVIATHVSFALLQTTFLVLLGGSRSWNLVFLSSVCGGLWAGTTWVMWEVAEMERLEREADRLRKVRIKRDQEAQRQVEEMMGGSSSQEEEGLDRDIDGGGYGRTEGKKVR